MSSSQVSPSSMLSSVSSSKSDPHQAWRESSARRTSASSDSTDSSQFTDFNDDSSQSSVESELSTKGRYTTIIARSTHAYATLNELRQSNAISSLGCDWTSVEAGWTAKVSLTLSGHDTTITTEATCLSKSHSKKQASEIGLGMFMEYFNISPLCILPRATCTLVQPASTRQRKSLDEYTKPQLAQELIDATHVMALEAIANRLSSPVGSTSCVSIDLEMFDQDSTTVLEVGISYLTTESLATANPIRSHHLIIEESMDTHNGKYCEDNKFNFLFGVSEVIKQDDLGRRVTEILTEARECADTSYLLGHSIEGDVKWLKDLGIDMDLYGMGVCDIGRAYRLKKSPLMFRNQPGMEQMLKEMSLSSVYLHNGGNDARYNIDVLLTMIGRNPDFKDDIMYQWANAVELACRL